MVIDLRQIEIFHMIVDQGSLSGAARSLGVSQPAISASLGKLETQIGFSLFHREARAVRLTTEGELFYKEALETIGSLARLEAAAAGIASARTGKLTIATNPGPGIAWLPRIIGPFLAERPDVSFRLVTRRSPEVRDMLAADVCDLGVAEPPFDRQDAVLRRLRFDCYVAMRRDHSLADQELITPSLLSGHPLITMLPGHGVSRGIAQILDDTGIDCPIVAECDFFASALNLVAQGCGLCFVDRINGQDASPDVVLRPVLPTVTYEVAILRPARRGMSRLAEAFANALIDYVNPFLQEAS